MSGAKVFIIFILIFITALTGRYSPFQEKCPTRIIFLNVRQGDSALIQAECKDILIDGGPGDYILTSLGRYMPYHDMQIDLVILTHPHLDHLSGLLDVVKRYRIEDVWVNPVCYSSDPYKEFLDSVKFKSVDSDDKYFLDNGYLEVIYPFNNLEILSGCGDNPGLLESTGENVNNDSINLIFKYGKFKILFTGDSELELEGRLVKEAVLSKVDILKAGHHCSNTSSSEQFLDIVRPELVVCSLAEKNRYGHPGKETIDRFNDRGIKYILLYKYRDYEVWLE